MALALPSRLSYASVPHWRRIHDALPQRLRIPEPWPVHEEWRQVGQFDVHIDRWPAKNPRASVIVVHGAGGNGRLLAIYGEMCRSLGYDAVAPDLPGYGVTGVPSKSALCYEDWRTVVAAVMEAEARRGLPIIALGLSAGGLLAYEAAARTRLPKGLVVSCFFDPREPQARRGVARFPSLNWFVEPLLTGAPTLIDRLSIPMALVIKMKAIANDAALSNAIGADPRAGGNRMPGRFLRTLLTAEPEVPPESFDVCPVMLAHPADDHWTDVSISRLFFDRLSCVRTELVMLENGGHFPVEYPAHEQLVTAFGRFVEATTATWQPVKDS
ncbi:MAG: alpha/beta hydrolase [Methylobacteriaceae bacterium]|nr:alpha/beta hydrolase [Methylobacteriaceae bacterium]